MDKKMMREQYETFELWWYEVGSGIPINATDDIEEHTKKIAELAWNAATGGEVTSS